MRVPESTRDYLKTPDVPLAACLPVRVGGRIGTGGQAARGTRSPFLGLHFPFALCLFLAGCGGRITPPNRPFHPMPVFVADYGRHSSLLLPGKEGGLIEFAWGDYDWFASSKTGFVSATRALFASRGSTFGMRWLAVDSRFDDLCRITGSDRLLCFDAPEGDVIALRAKLIDRFDRRRDTALFNPVNGSTFVRDDGHYSAFHNCNHVTAEWLRELDCRVDGLYFFSDFKLNSK